MYIQAAASRTQIYQSFYYSHLIIITNFYSAYILSNLSLEAQENIIIKHNHEQDKSHALCSQVMMSKSIKKILSHVITLRRHCY